MTSLIDLCSLKVLSSPLYYTAPIYHENAKCLFLTRYFHFHTKYWCIVLQEILKIEPPIMLLQYHWSWEHVMHLLQCIGIGSVRVALDQSLEQGPVQILTRAANEPSAKFSQSWRKRLLGPNPIHYNNCVADPISCWETVGSMPV